jgi:membrane dipeptidase
MMGAKPGCAFQYRFTGRLSYRQDGAGRRGDAMSDTKAEPVSAQAHELLRDALVWDAHSGFWPAPDTDLENLKRWTDGGVDFLSIDVGFDVIAWTDAVLNLAAYRAWLAQRPERFVLVERGDDILRARKEGKLAIAFDIEGANMLAGQVSMVSLYYRLGVRQMLFAYNLNNEAGGGCHDDDHGLTEFGRAVLKEMNRVGMLVDLSHAGFRTSMELAERSTAPVIFSHSNPKAMVPHPRNITDEQMHAAVATGGIVGVNGVGRFLGAAEPTAEHLVRAIDMTVERIGAGNVGIGLDYAWASIGLARHPKFWPEEHYPAGAKFSYVAPGQLPETVERLLRLGYKDPDIRGILGDNFLRVARKVWK